MVDDNGEHAAGKTVERWVQSLHDRAARQPDPVAFMRQMQAEAEDRWFETGQPVALEYVRALEASIGPPPTAGREDQSNA